MSRTRNLCAGAIATLSSSFLVASLTATVAFTIQPPDADGLGERQFRHPDLWWGSVYQPVADLPAGLTQDLSADLSLLGVDPGNAYFDRRTGRWGTLILTRPLVPGGGVGNDLRWSDLGLAEPRGAESLEQAAWQAFRAWLTGNAAALRFDPEELGEPSVTAIGERLIQIHVGRVVDGIPVRDTFVTAVINSGNLVLTGQRNWSEVSLDTTPRIAAGAAETILRHYLDGFPVTGVHEPARLEIVPVSDQDDGTRIAIGAGLDHRLAWVLRPAIDNDLGSWEALVDAHTGEVLSFQDRNEYLSRRVEGGIFPVSNDGVGDDGTLQFDYPMPFADVLLDGSPLGTTTTGGNIPPGGDSGALSTALSGPFILMDDQCGVVDESAAAGDLDLEGVPLPGTDCEVPAGHSAGDTNASRTGFYELNRLVEQARGYLPGNAWVNSQLEANMNITQACNAFWSPPAGTVNFYRFGLNSGRTCRNTGEIAAVFDHEWGHGMDDNNGNGSVSRPGEGIADMFAQNRLNSSCIGRGFWVDNPNSPTNPNCDGFGDPCLDCTGVREVDWAKHQSGLPHGADFAVACPSTIGSTGPCGRATHCEGHLVSETAWDFVHRDLMGFEGSPFNFDLNTALELGTRLAYSGSNIVSDWYQCSFPDPASINGCNADGGYLQFLAADDDDGDLTNGTPHMTALFAAFDRHDIACATPVVQNSGCAGAPTTAPTNLATTVFDEGMELTWDPVADATEYQIFRTEGVNGCDFGKTLVGTTTGTSFTEEGLRNGFEVLYSVMAVGASDACTSPMSACEAVIPVAGPSGTLDGTVTNSVTTDPIQGVTIEAAGPVTLSGLTLADGTYQISAPVGTYDITASKEGFFPQTVAGVEVTEGGTFTNDFALDPLPQTVDVTPASFTFEVFEGQGDDDTLTVGNVGNIDLTWNITEAETDCATPSDVTWLSADPVSGVTPPFSSLPVAVAVDATGVPPGTHEARFCVNSDDPATPVVAVPVSLIVVAAPAIDVVPDAITVSVEAGQTHMETLTVNNLGSIQLDWAIVQEALRRGLNAPLGGYRPVTDGAPRSGLLLAPADGSADTAFDAELVAAAEAGIELSEPLPPDQRPRARATSPNDVLQDGALIVPNTTAGFIVALDPETGDVIDPALIDIAPATAGARREALLHPDGERVLLSHQIDDVVYQFSVEDGSFLGVFAPAGGADTSIINNVRGMDFHPVTGNLLVTSSDSPAADRVVEFDLEGNFVRVFIDSAPQGGLSPWDMLVRESDILLTDSGDGTRRYDFDGNFLGDFETITNFPEQIAFAANGNILIASLFGDLYEFAPDGTLVAQYLDTVTSVAGVYELPNLNFALSGSISGTGQGIQELDRTNTLVRNILDGTSYQINFAQSLDCTFPSWLTVNPTSGSTGPGGSTDVTVTIDTDLLGLGEHTASICFESNDPIEPLVVVPVTLTVFGDVPMADISPSSFDVSLPFGGSTMETLNIGNVGTLDLTWSIDESAVADCATPVDVSWLSVAPISGTTPPSDSIPVDVTIDAAGLAGGVYEAALCVATNDGDNLLVPVPVTLTVQAPGADISPESFSFEVFEGGADGDVLNIGNIGTIDLEWSLAEAETDCSSPADVPWLTAAPTAGTTPPGSSLPVDVSVDTTGLGPGVFTAQLCVTTNDTTAPLVAVPVELTVLAAPEIDVVPDSLDVVVEVDTTHDEPVEIHNLGSGVLNWSIPTDPAVETLGESDPLIGFTFKSSGATTPDPQNWTRISTGDGSLANVQDDAGEATDVTFTWGAIVGSMSFLGTSTLAADAVPQYDYDLSGMTGYGFGSGDRFFIELSGLDPNAPYEFWMVAYRSGSAIDNLVEVSDGDVVNAFQFHQTISSGDNDGRFIINDQVSSDTQHWNDLSFSTTSSSTGTLRIEWEGDTQTTAVIGAFAVRPLLNCALPSWLSIAPTTGSIDPGDPPDTVSVTFDTTGLAPGAYTDAFCVESNDPFEPVVPVPVNLLALSGQVPVADISPSSFEVELSLDGNTTETLNVGNIGLGDLTWSIAEADAAATCDSPVDVPWLSVSPASGTTPPMGGNVPVDVTIDALGLSGGVYEAALCVSTNDEDNPLVPVPVALTVEAPGADISPASFAFEVFEGGTDADVLNIGNVGTVDLDWSLGEAETDCASPADVSWLSAAPAAGTTPPAGSVPVDVSVDTTGLPPGVVTAQLCVTTNDTTAPLVAVPVQLSVLSSAVIDVVPAELAVTLELDGSGAETLEVHNSGTATLDWTILLDGGLRGLRAPLSGRRAATLAGPRAGYPLAPPVGEHDDVTGSDAEAIEAAAGDVDEGPAAEGSMARSLGLTPEDVLRDGALILANTTSDTIVALDPETGNVIEPALIDTSAFSGNLDETVLHPDGERILVSSRSGDVVHAFSVADGSYLGVFAPAGGQDTSILNNVRGMEFHPVTGNLLVTSASAPAADRVVEFDLEGNFVRVFIDGAASGLGSPFDMLVRDSDILVTDGLDGTERYDFDGNHLGAFETITDFPEQIALSPNGNILIASFSGGLYEFDQDGNLIANYKGTVTSQRGIYELPNENFLVSGSSGGNGVHELGRDNILVETKVDGTSFYINFAQTLDCTIPSWLNVDPTSGSTDPGTLDTVTASFDATGLAPGEYTASICFESNDPEQPILEVPVTLTVVLPSNFATIEGTVQGLGYCGADVSALEGATVQIAGAANDFELQTDEDGFYQIFLPDSESPIDITVSADGHLPATVEDIVFAGGDTVVQDFELTLDAPCATVDPASFAFDLRKNEVATDTLTIGNAAGGAELSWTITTAEAASAEPSWRSHFPSTPRFVEHKNDAQLSADRDPAVGEGVEPGARQPALGGAVPAYTTTGFNVVGYVTFDAVDPSSLTVINASQPTNMYAATFIDNDFSQGYMLASSGGNQPIDTFGTIDTATGTFTAMGTVSGSPGGTWSSMKWDHSTGTLYAVNIVGFGDSRLFNIDPVTLEATLVGSIAGPGVSPDVGVIAIAISPEGLMYGIDISDDVLLAIDKTTGDAAVIGTLGPNANFAQDMDFDQTTGVLYWAGYQGGGDSQMFTVDTATGVATSIGNVFGGSELLSFAIALPGSAIDCDSPTNIPWLSVDPDAGVTAPGDNSPVQVTADTRGIPPGEYTAGLCVASNDPQQPLTVVPVSLNVSPSGLTLAAEGRRVQGFHVVDLFWDGAISDDIDVWRNGALVATVPNSGMHTDETGNRGRARYVYEVCEAGTAVCSDKVTVVFGPPGGGR